MRKNPTAVLVDLFKQVQWLGFFILYCLS